jgi:hypothetical protein
MDSPESLSAVLLGLCAAVGLSAAAGFRVFVPFFIASLGARAGMLDLTGEFAWLASTPALVGFGGATALEIGAYYVPWLDNALDTIATPAAAVAGALISSAVLVDMDPSLRWTLSVVAGAGVATAVQIPTAAIRAVSTGTTGGVANPVVSTGEAVGASVFSGVAVMFAIRVPLLILGLGLLFWRWRKRRRGAALALEPAT